MTLSAKKKKGTGKDQTVTSKIPLVEEVFVIFLKEKKMLRPGKRTFDEDNENNDKNKGVIKSTISKLDIHPKLNQEAKSKLEFTQTKSNSGAFCIYFLISSLSISFFIFPSSNSNLPFKLTKYYQIFTNINKYYQK